MGRRPGARSAVVRASRSLVRSPLVGVGSFAGLPLLLEFCLLNACRGDWVDRDDSAWNMHVVWFTLSVLVRVMMVWIFLMWQVHIFVYGIGHRVVLRLFNWLHCCGSIKWMLPLLCILPIWRACFKLSCLMTVVCSIFHECTELKKYEYTTLELKSTECFHYIFIGHDKLREPVERGRGGFEWVVLAGRAEGVDPGCGRPCDFYHQSCIVLLA